jgi:hypothetical protein
MTRDVKTCTKCAQQKPVGEFGLHRGKRQGACKTCERDRAARYRLCGSAAVAEDGVGLTHQEIANLLGVSRSLVQLIESRALKKMRAAVQEGWR